MRNRVIGFLLALCYLSAGLVFSGHHSHDHGKSLSHQCAVCAWHTESVSDVPSTPALIVAPEILIQAVDHAAASFVSSLRLLPSDRGPPSVS